jgi:antitoxin (DNA-binding transcriptional repressor) of toxin-antitoxin stability system
MRALDGGKSFIITRNGVPVGELVPLRQHDSPAFVPEFPLGYCPTHRGIVARVLQSVQA